MGCGYAVTVWGCFSVAVPVEELSANYESSTVSTASFIATYSSCCSKYYS